MHWEKKKLGMQKNAIHETEVNVKHLNLLSRNGMNKLLKSMAAPFLNLTNQLL